MTETHARRCREPWTPSPALLLLACVASLGLATNLTADINLDSIPGQVPASDTAGSHDPSRPLRILVPIPRLCRIVSSEVTFRCSKTDWLDRSVALFSEEAVEAGKAFAAFDVGRGVAGQLDISIDYEPLPAAERPARESLLLATCGGQTAGSVLRTAECAGWYPDEDTSLVDFFGACPPEDFDFRELSRMPLNCDVVIAVCTGGWGRVPLQRAPDIAPTAYAMRDSMASWGLSVLVVPYLRVSGGMSEDPFLQLTEMFGANHKGSRAFAREINRLLGSNPEIRVVLIGLSNGATFVGQTMKMLEAEAQSRVSVVQLGPPAWTEQVETPNTLLLDNDGDDAAAVGKLDIQLGAFFSGLGRYLWLQLAGRPVPFARALQVPGHVYAWGNIGPSIIPFLRSQLGLDDR